MTNWKNVDTDISGIKISNDDGFVGRAFLGYDLNRYFALEAGYTYFFVQPKEKNTAGTEQNKIKRTHNIDVMGKVKAPVADNFDLYAKLGVNYLMSDFDKKTGGQLVITEDSRKYFNVAYGAGADYCITPNIIANVEWLRFNGSAKIDKHYQPNTDAFMIGLRYKIEI